MDYEFTNSTMQSVFGWVVGEGKGFYKYVQFPISNLFIKYSENIAIETGESSSESTVAVDDTKKESGESKNCRFPAPNGGGTIECLLKHYSIWEKNPLVSCVLDVYKKTSSNKNIYIEPDNYGVIAIGDKHYLYDGTYTPANNPTNAAKKPYACDRGEIRHQT
jgi:hypothetical protein